MSAPTTRRFFNISAASLGTQGVTTIKTVSYDERTTRIVGMGDADAGPTFQARGSADATVTITMDDAIQAQAMKVASAADFTFQGQTSTGGTNKLVTIKNFQVFNRSSRDAHDKLGEITLTGHGFDPAGGPVITEALAT